MLGTLQPSSLITIGCCLYGLEADPAILDARIVDSPPENPLATGADVGDDDAEHFQAIFQLFQVEVFLRYHE